MDAKLGGGESVRLAMKRTERAALAAHRPREAGAVAETLARRAGVVLGVAAALGYRNSVLGAWGCGVFRNDPRVVAAAFACHLRGRFAGQFTRVQFSVLDRSPESRTFEAFAEEFVE